MSGKYQPLPRDPSSVSSLYTPVVLKHLLATKLRRLGGILGKYMNFVCDTSRVCSSCSDWNPSRGGWTTVSFHSFMYNACRPGTLGSSSSCDR